MSRWLTVILFVFPLLASSNVASAMFCVDLVLQKLAEEIESMSPEAAADLLARNKFMRFNQESMEYLKKNAGKEQLQGMRIAIRGGTPPKIIIGDILDTWDAEKNVIS